jgi:hypothetical protein
VRALRLLVMAAMLAGVVPVVAPVTAAQAAQEDSRAGESTAPPSKWGDNRVPQDPRKAPAQGEPYAWRQMALAAVIMAGMLVFVVWLIRRQKRR